MTINIVVFVTKLSVDNGAVIRILLSLDNLDFTAIKDLDPTADSLLKTNGSISLKRHRHNTVQVARLFSGQKLDVYMECKDK